MSKITHFIGFIKFMLQQIKILYIFMWFNMGLSISTWFMDLEQTKWALIYYLVSGISIVVYWFIIQPIKKAYLEYSAIIDKM